MPYSVVEISHRNLIDVIEAVYLQGDNCKVEDVVDFMDITKESAKQALNFACQLNLIEKENDKYVSEQPFSRLFTNGNITQKKNIMKYILFEYEPFRYFAAFVTKGEDPTRAAHKTKEALNVSGSVTIMKNTFLDLGIFCGVFKENEEGTIVSFELPPEILEVFEYISDILDDETKNSAFIMSQFDDETAKYIDEYRERLETSAIKFSSEPEVSIKNTADIFEDFLKKIAGDEGIDITGSNGIIEVGGKLKQEDKITNKHLGFIDFIGHVRNAFKHTTDSETGRSWDVSSNLSLEVLMVTITAINSIYLYAKKKKCIL